MISRIGVVLTTKFNKSNSVSRSHRFSKSNMLSRSNRISRSSRIMEESSAPHRRDCPATPSPGASCWSGALDGDPILGRRRADRSPAPGSK